MTSVCFSQNECGPFFEQTSGPNDVRKKTKKLFSSPENMLLRFWQWERSSNTLQVITFGEAAAITCVPVRPDISQCATVHLFKPQLTIITVSSLQGIFAWKCHLHLIVLCLTRLKFNWFIHPVKTFLRFLPACINKIHIKNLVFEKHSLRENNLFCLFKQSPVSLQSAK